MGYQTYPSLQVFIANHLHKPAADQLSQERGGEPVVEPSRLPVKAMVRSFSACNRLKNPSPPGEGRGFAHAPPMPPPVRRINDVDIESAEVQHGFQPLPLRSEAPAWPMPQANPSTSGDALPPSSSEPPLGAYRPHLPPTLPATPNTPLWRSMNRTTRSRAGSTSSAIGSALSRASSGDRESSGDVAAEASAEGRGRAPPQEFIHPRYVPGQGDDFFPLPEPEPLDIGAPFLSDDIIFQTTAVSSQHDCLFGQSTTDDRQFLEDNQRAINCNGVDHIVCRQPQYEQNLVSRANNLVKISQSSNESVHIWPQARQRYNVVVSNLSSQHTDRSLAMIQARTFVVDCNDQRILQNMLAEYKTSYDMQHNDLSYLKQVYGALFEAYQTVCSTIPSENQKFEGYVMESRTTCLELRQHTADLEIAYAQLLHATSLNTRDWIHDRSRIEAFADAHETILNDKLGFEVANQDLHDVNMALEITIHEFEEAALLSKSQYDKLQKRCIELNNDVSEHANARAVQTIALRPQREENVLLKAENEGYAVQLADLGQQIEILKKNVIVPTRQHSVFMITTPKSPVFTFGTRDCSHR